MPESGSVPFGCDSTCPSLKLDLVSLFARPCTGRSVLGGFGVSFLCRKLGRNDTEGHHDPLLCFAVLSQRHSSTYNKRLEQRFACASFVHLSVVIPS